MVLKHAHNAAEIGDEVRGKITEFALRGFRALGVAKTDDINHKRAPPGLCTAATCILATSTVACMLPSCALAACLCYPECPPQIAGSAGYLPMRAAEMALAAAPDCLPLPGAAADAKWDFVVLLPLFDPPRHDTKQTIEQCIEKGIQVKMVTGDQLLIGKETAKQLGMGTNMYTTEVLLAVRLISHGPLPILGMNSWEVHGGVMFPL